jgi:hypothetical protein
LLLQVQYFGSITTVKTFKWDGTASKLHLPRRAGGIGFQNLLFKELSELGGGRSGPTFFGRVSPTGAIGYYFSPQAAELLQGFIAVWDGIPVEEPTDSSSDRKSHLSRFR